MIKPYSSLYVPTGTPNDLCIRDVGYFHLTNLQHIQNEKCNISLVVNKEEICEISDTYVGMANKVSTRVIVHRLTKEQQNTDYKIKL
ncbi:hypothetical protein BK720_08100 [Bacillus thuringiensis serovar brasilensis]|nr:hypothetical protein [Bacillus thuringiensis]MCU5031451.1 hypothetical protein [Bacillus cereus]MRA74184.1 hypothetical protein [Bacillus thuringiensis]MRA92706.1 hypothetical protein [Bacillus thuringiensis]OTX35235.1 hypothetical protein BK720_08100 [Bacillus thuringiensis serovar brasilensis]HDR4441478.1 hypothetical protein [Bacillus cereus]